jgi:hypothetical protein
LVLVFARAVCLLTIASVAQKLIFLFWLSSSLEQVAI